MYAYNTIYDLSGSSTSLKADLSRIIYRDNKSKLTTNISINRKNTKSYFEDVNLIDRNLSIGTIGLNYDFLFFKGIANIGASYSKGLRVLNAENDKEKGNYSPRAEAERYNISMYWYKPIKNVTFRLMGDYQNSRNINYSTEKMTIGGIGSVPGYQYDTIAGDIGYSVIGELSYTFRIKNAKLIPYISYGVGETKNNKDSSEYKYGRVKGGSLGLRFSSKYFDFDVAYAKPLSHSKYLETKDHEVYASMALKISF